MTDYTPTTEEVRDCYATGGPMPGPRLRERFASDYAEFDRWLAQERAEAKVEALREAAGVLDVPGAVNFGDGGVFVRVDFCDPNRDVPLVLWLRDRAAKLEGK